MIRPTVRQRPGFAHWRYERNLNLRDTAQLIEQAALAIGEELTCSHEMVRLLCLPFGSQRRRVPGPAMMRAIGHLTSGVIREGDFFETQREAA